MTQIAITIIRAPGCATPMRTFDGVSGNTFGATSWTDGFICGPMLQPAYALLKCRSEGTFFWREECEEIDSRIDPDTRSDWFLSHDFEFAAEPTTGDLMEAIGTGMGSTRTKELYLRTSLWHRYNDRCRYLGRPISEHLSGERAEDWKFRVHRAFQANGCNPAWFVSRLASRDGLDMPELPRHTPDVTPPPSIGRLHDFFYRAFQGDNLDFTLAGRFEAAFSGVVERRFWTTDVTDNLKAMLPLLSDDDGATGIVRAEIFRELGEFEVAKRTLTGCCGAKLTQLSTFLHGLASRGDRMVRRLPANH